MTSPILQKGIFSDAVKLSNRNSYVGLVTINGYDAIAAEISGKLLNNVGLSEIDSTAKLDVLVNLESRAKTYRVEQLEVSYPKSPFIAQLSDISVKENGNEKRFAGKLMVQQGCFARFLLFADSSQLLSVTEQTVFMVKVHYQQDKNLFKFVGFSVKAEQFCRCKVMYCDMDGVQFEIEYSNGALFSIFIPKKALKILNSNGLAINFEQNKTLTLPIAAYRSTISIVLTPKFGPVHTGALRFTRYLTEQGRKYALFYVDDSNIEVKILSSEWLLFNIAEFKPGAVIDATIKIIDSSWFNIWQIIRVNSDLAKLASLPPCSMQKVLAIFPWSINHNGHPFELAQQKQLAKSHKHSAILQVLSAGKINLAVFVTVEALSKNKILSIAQNSQGKAEITMSKASSHDNLRTDVVAVGKILFDNTKSTKSTTYSEVWVTLEQTKMTKKDKTQFIFKPLASSNICLNPYTDSFDQLSHFKTPNVYKYRVLLSNIGDQYFVSKILQLEKL